MDLDKWVCFNDSHARQATAEEVMKTFGGSFDREGNPNPSAYMLVYRKIDSQKNEPFIRTAELPPHLDKWVRPAPTEITNKFFVDLATKKVDMGAASFKLKQRNALLEEMGKF